MSGLMGSGRWHLLAGDPAAERTIASACGVAPIVARALVSRGIRTPEEARRFLTPSLERDWLDPLVIPGMEEVARRVRQAIEKGQTIAVFGDFDVDGMSATCLLTLGLRDLGATVHPYIPDRFREGYGLSQVALERVLADCHPQLLLTVDNGIAARREVEWLLDRGVDVAITDHHEPAELVPVGVPVADPKLEGDCPSRELAGAGVALKLIQVLGGWMGKPDLWRAYTEVATLGTISDMMVLADENRALVTDGVARMRQTDRPGIVALAATARQSLAELTADALPFSLIPRLNAAGRMGNTEVAFDLLMAGDMLEAQRLAAQLEDINARRREIEGALAEEVLGKVQDAYQGERVIVEGGVGWHEGVKGIVASRVANRYHVPTLLFSVKDGVARGSGRSVGQVDLFKAVEQCSDLLIRFGGHAGAVGVTCQADRLDALRDRLSQVLGQLPAADFQSRGEVTAVVSLSEMTVENLDALELLQPFGQGNKKPLFAALGVSMRGRGKVGAQANHLRFSATDGLATVPAIMFRAPDIDRAVSCEEVVDLVFEPVNETWQGRTKPKLMVKDILYHEDDGGSEDAAGFLDGIYQEASRTLDGAGGAPALAPTSYDGGSVASTGERDMRDGGSVASTGEDLLAPSAHQDYADLTDRLRALMIGPAPLLPAQAAALDRLAQGRSCLCVMATGRGKSLIFHIHAAREALAHGRASVFVYPLRALVADQAFHLASSFDRLGLGVRVLTGETPLEERARTYRDLAAGTVSVVLTTPEYLALHVDDLAASGRVGFLVVDEAHHGNVLSGEGRGAYGELPRVLEALGGPTALAVTATADDRTAREVAGLLSVAAEDVIVDASARDNLHLVDLRQSRDRDCALASAVATGQKTVIYVNSRGKSLSLAQTLRKEVPSLGHRIAFYNAGMPREVRTRVEDFFRAGLLTTIVSTSAFGEGVNLPDVRNVVLYHMPFDMVEFNQMSGRAGRDGEDAAIWLLFGPRDARINERILAAAAPRRETMAHLYATIRGLCGPTGTTTASDEDLAACAQATDTLNAYDKSEAATAVATFHELGFIQLRQTGTERRISMVADPQRASLDQSSNYLSGLSQAAAFETFRDWVLSSDGEELLRHVVRPIVPDFGQVVDGNGGDDDQAC